MNLAKAILRLRAYVKAPDCVSIITYVLIKWQSFDVTFESRVSFLKIPENNDTLEWNLKGSARSAGGYN